ncbi:MAG TPA: LptF/LptG family permease, partial [Candidatus Thermoplasmatota archaeon]|nr:LptF/LptG family permease [Candidatus Thermoplasmatota archaeon]
TNGEIHQEDPSPEVDRYIRTRFDRTTYIVKNINFSLDTSSESPRNDRSMTSMMMRERIKEHTKMIDEWKQRSKDISTNDPSRDAKIKNIDYQLKNLKHQISAYLVEIHKKNSIPFAAVIFVLIGSSLGILARTSGASIGIGMSIGFFTLYYLFLIGGESAGDRMLIAPWLAMWAPNFILGAVGIGLFVYATRR